MGKTQLNVRLPEGILEALDKRANKTGESKTDIVYKALASHLGIGSTEPDISDIVKRLERLETKFKQGTPSDQNDPMKTSDQNDHKLTPDELGELITKSEAAELTGYSENYFSGIFHRKGIYEISKRGKAGLYRKDEIMERIGIKN